MTIMAIYKGAMEQLQNDPLNLVTRARFSDCLEENGHIGAAQKHREYIKIIEMMDTPTFRWIHCGTVMAYFKSNQLWYKLYKDGTVKTNKKHKRPTPTSEQKLERRRMRIMARALMYL